ncbi:transposase [Enterobacter cancerogenus]|uniref:Transposase n=1 Tax=Enterobacter cancerogenus TaxID=69218 RepID=A0A484WVF2_9ENTR|nr:transposase [Enterobacter cancerogenus]
MLVSRRETGNKKYEISQYRHKPALTFWYVSSDKKSHYGIKDLRRCSDGGSINLDGFPDCCLESFSGNGFRENRDGVRSSSANGHDDDPRRSGESQRLSQVTVFLERSALIGRASRLRRSEGLHGLSPVLYSVACISHALQNCSSPLMTAGICSSKNLATV